MLRGVTTPGHSCRSRIAPRTTNRRYSSRPGPSGRATLRYAHRAERRRHGQGALIAARSDEISSASQHDNAGVLGLVLGLDVDGDPAVLVVLAQGRFDPVAD